MSRRQTSLTLKRLREDSLDQVTKRAKQNLCPSAEVVAAPLQNEQNLYQPQNQLHGAHSDRICSYDRVSSDKMDGQTARASSSRFSNSYKPSTYEDCNQLPKASVSTTAMKSSISWSTKTASITHSLGTQPKALPKQNPNISSNVSNSQGNQPRIRPSNPYAKNSDNPKGQQNNISIAYSTSETPCVPSTYSSLVTQQPKVTVAPKIQPTVNPSQGNPYLKSPVTANTIKTTTACSTQGTILNPSPLTSVAMPCAQVQNKTVSKNPALKPHPSNPYLKSQSKTLQHGNASVDTLPIQLHHKQTEGASSQPMARSSLSNPYLKSPTKILQHGNASVDTQPRQSHQKQMVDAFSCQKTMKKASTIGASPNNPHTQSQQSDFQNGRSSSTNSTGMLADDMQPGVVFQTSARSASPLNPYLKSPAMKCNKKESFTGNASTTARRTLNMGAPSSPNSSLQKSDEICGESPKSCSRTAALLNPYQKMISPGVPASDFHNGQSNAPRSVNKGPLQSDRTSSNAKMPTQGGAGPKAGNNLSSGNKFPQSTLLPPKNSVSSFRPPSWKAEILGSPTIHSTARSSPSKSDQAQPLSDEGQKTKRPEIPGEAPLPEQLVYDPDSFAAPLLDEYRWKLSRNAALHEPLLNGWTLYGHQRQAIGKALMKRRVILALDMGLGKTLIGCVWAKAFKKSYEKLKIFVVCPASLREEWARTASNATGLEVDPEKNCSADSLDMTIATWAKIPAKVNEEAIEHFVAVFDEAHNMQSMESKRTAAALKLVNNKRCVGVLLLTGTPMKNGKPSNLFPLLRAVKHPLGRDQRAYEAHFCQGGLRSVGGRGMQWIASGQANLKQLHRMIGTSLLHMTKEEFLKEIPPMKREKREVPISARFRERYAKVVKELADLKNAMKTNRNIDDHAILGKTQELRMICAQAKADATVGITRDILEKEGEGSVVIFTNFETLASRMCKALTDAGQEVALFTGKTPLKKRQAMVDGFQKELYSVFIATFGAGGVGLTLTKAHTLIFLDRPWTPGDVVQAEDRIRRIGQTKPTRSIWVSAFEFDSQLDNMLEEKDQASKAVLTKANTISASSSINFEKLVAAILRKSSIFV